LASLTSKNDPVERGDRALAFGLSAVPSEKATEALGKLLVKHRLTREGRGPWIELIGQSGGPNELRRLFDQAARNEFDDKTTLRALTALSDAMRLRKVKPAGDVQGLVALLSRSNEHIRAAALRLAGIWRLESWAQRLAAMATDGACPLICRSACCDSLGALRGSTAVNALKAVAANAADAPTLRRQALLVLASFEPEVALPLVHDAIRKADAVDAEEMWRSLLGIAGLGKRLTDSVRKEPLPRSVAMVALRVARESDESHRELVKLLASQAGQPEPKIYSGTELQQIAAQARRRGDPDRGELVYRRSEQRCIACHSIGGAGGKVGPDMTSLGASAPLDYLIESVLMPNRKIKEGYHAIVVLTNDGRVFTGILVRETAVEMFLRDATDKEIAIPLNSIEQRGDAGSLMPAGLLDTLPERDQLDLFCFLGQLGRPGRFDATKSKAARAWQLLAVPDENKPLGAKARQGDPALAWTMIPTTVAGWLPKAEVQTLAKSASKTVFAATRFEAAKAGKIKLQTNVTSNVPVWLDGQPVQLDSETRIAVTRGTHVLVLQVSPATLPDRFRLESSDVVFLGGW